MTRAAVLSPALTKEIRALLPLWLASIATVILAIVWRGNDLLLMAYVVGCVAIGAHAVGHEYSYRTLSMVLSHPADRRRVYLLKFAVSAAMLLTLALLAAIVFDDVRPGAWPFTLVVLSVVGGLSLAPLMTMICRNSLAGMALSSTLLACTWIGTVAIAWFGFGIDSDTAERDIIGPWTFAMMVVCALSGALGWRQFARLEASDGTSRALHLPRWWQADAGGRSYRPIAALAMKELHLQQLTFAIGVFFVIVWGFLVLAHRYIPSWSDAPLGAVVLMYCMGLAIVIGALASAEERQYGTHEWQRLQPSPAWQQWLVKIFITFGLAMAFGYALPTLLMRAWPHHSIRVSADLAMLIVLLTASSIYISSLSSSGVRAVVLALPAGVGAAYFVKVVSEALRAVTHWISGPSLADIVTGAVLPSSTEAANVVIFAGRILVLMLIALLVWLGFVNHQSSARSARRIVQQVTAIGLCIATGIISVGALLAFLS